MLGFLRKKKSPYEFGFNLGNEAIKYTKPVYDGLMKFVRNWSLTDFNQQKILTDPYYDHMISIYSAVAFFEFCMFQMRELNINTGEIRRGFHGRLDELGKELEAHYGEQYQLELDFISEQMLNEIETNVDFSQRSLIYNEDDIDGCLAAGLLRKISVYALGGSAIERELTSSKHKNEMLEAFMGIDRGIRWLISVSDPKGIK